MVADRAEDAQAWSAGRPREIKFSQVVDAAPADAFGMRLPDAPGPFRTLAHGVQLVPGTDASSLFHTIYRADVIPDRGWLDVTQRLTAAVMDSQSVRAPGSAARGYDGGKPIVGRKRHITADTDGRVLMVNLKTADASNSALAKTILDAIRKRWPLLKHLLLTMRMTTFRSTNDRGNQFASLCITNLLKNAGVRISIGCCDGWMHNVLIELFYRSLNKDPPGVEVWAKPVDRLLQHVPTAFLADHTPVQSCGTAVMARLAA